MPTRNPLTYTPFMQEATADLEVQVISLVAKSKSLDPAAITPQTTFDDLNIDSLDKINLSFEVEELFGIQIPDASLNSLRNVGDVIEGVRRLRAEQQSPLLEPAETAKSQATAPAQH